MSMTGCFRHIAPERLDDIAGDAAAITDLLLAKDESGSALDLEKAWHVVHYLITGTAGDGEGPASSAVLGGRVVSEDLGYGPARWLDADEVRATAAALENVDPAQLASQFDVAKVIRSRFIRSPETLRKTSMKRRASGRSSLSSRCASTTARGRPGWRRDAPRAALTRSPRWIEALIVLASPAVGFSGYRQLPLTQTSTCPHGRAGRLEIVCGERAVYD